MIYSTKHQNRIPILLLLLLGTLSIQAQSLSQTVIGNSGSFQSNLTAGNLHWTVGEVAVETFENDLILSQGFHQMYYDLFVTPVWEVEEQFELSLFPNPTAGWLRLENKSGLPFEIVITNLLGQQILSTNVEQFQTDFDLAPYPNGLYLFSVLQKGRTVKSFKINKQSN
jgi:hypothetical protein